MSERKIATSPLNQMKVPVGGISCVYTWHCHSRAGLSPFLLLYVPSVPQNCPSYMTSVQKSRHHTMCVVRSSWKITILARLPPTAASLPSPSPAQRVIPQGRAYQQLHFGDLVKGAVSLKPWGHGSSFWLSISLLSTLYPIFPHIKMTPPAWSQTHTSDLSFIC